ncbi:MA3 domain-domain-containing protein [Aspergillus welwitschiae]|uniref:MA3 domain-domain-containing protein n=1 Tax=Aspergillus welwitschiae TaxID=1341132 RepID=A0A3F3QDU0_9EURO|nr:MA3 domain-domain-containing protein [Aspergillus welwitschiae]RDH37255.1 MA3 domain-domain-containing protein [Aspergillus welwitschiae]
MSGPIALAVFDQFRNILHEADIDKRVQYMIEVLFQVRKDRYKDNPAIKEELDLIEEEDQITHQIGLDDEIETQDSLNIFKYDAEWEEHEEAYKKLKAEILGEGSDDEEDDEDESDESSDEESEEERKMDIKDQTNTDLVNLRRTIYLTIMSSIDFEECCHKLMKISLPAGLEPELPSMIIECCSQERTYSKFYGLIGERFAKINRLWSDLFEAAFAKYYDTIHRYETNRLRNIARFFGHMISNDAIGWHVMSIIHMNEEETTSSSRIFIKILFQDLGEHLGLPKLQERMRDEILRPSFEGLFPLDNPRNTRFSINYFTSIGMGMLTEDMREHLKNLPKPTMPALPQRDAGADSDSESVVSHPTSCSTCTPRSRSRSRSYSYSRSPSPGRGRRRSVSRGRSYSRSVSGSSRRSYSYTPSRSRSRSPAPKSRRRSVSYSRSPRRRSSVSPTPPPRRTRDRSYDSRSPRRSLSRSVTPPPRSKRDTHARRDRSYSRSVSRSVSPPPRQAAGGAARYSKSPPPRRRVERSVSASRSPSRSRSRTPERRAPPGRRAPRDASVSRSRSPTPPRGGGRRGDAAPRRRRYSDSLSPSRSPPPRRHRSPSRTPPRRVRD